MNYSMLALESVCLSIAGHIVVVMFLLKIYGFRDKKRNSVQEVKK